MFKQGADSLVKKRQFGICPSPLPSRNGRGFCCVFFTFSQREKARMRDFFNAMVCPFHYPELTVKYLNPS